MQQDVLIDNSGRRQAQSGCWFWFGPHPKKVKRK
jgi:hypothetical protein